VRFDDVGELRGRFAHIVYYHSVEVESSSDRVPQFVLPAGGQAPIFGTHYRPVRQGVCENVKPKLKHIYTYVYTTKLSSQLSNKYRQYRQSRARVRMKIVVSVKRDFVNGRNRLGRPLSAIVYRILKEPRRFRSSCFESNVQTGRSPEYIRTRPSAFSELFNNNGTSAYSASFFLLFSTL